MLLFALLLALYEQDVTDFHILVKIEPVGNLFDQFAKNIDCQFSTFQIVLLLLNDLLGLAELVANEALDSDENGLAWFLLSWLYYLHRDCSGFWFGKFVNGV